MPTILAIPGSLRAKSYCSMIASAVASAPPNGTRIDLGTIEGIPLYDGDAEAQSGVPWAVQRLKQQIVDAEGLLLITPEYNNSLPGVFKNAVDWLSRPPADVKRIFRGRPIGLIGATPGSGGAMMAQAAWLPVFRALGASVWSAGRLNISQVDKKLDPDGHVIDATLRTRLESYLREFAAFVVISGARSASTGLEGVGEGVGASQAIR